MSKQPENSKPNLVVGQIVDIQNRPLPNLIVEIYDKDMRNVQLLATTTTNKEGRYEETWEHSQLSGRGRKEADILIKVLSSVEKTLLFESAIDSVRFNASPREEINITIGVTIEPEVVEYDFLLKEVTFLAKGVEIADLEENNQHQDITFLSRELKISPEKIEHLVIANKLQEVSEIDADFFYALLRKNTLLKGNANKINKRLSIDINTEIRPILFDAALSDSKLIRADIESAVKEMIVDTKVVDDAEKNIEILSSFREEAAQYYKKEQPQKIINRITRIVSSGKIQEVGKLFQENKNDLNAFFNKVSDFSFLNEATTTKEDKTNAFVADLVSFGSKNASDFLPLVKVSEQDIKDLAKLNKKEWVAKLTKNRTKLSDEDKASINTFASAIVRKLENEFPTIAFAAQLEREIQNPMLQNQKEIVSFMTKHDDFDLRKDNIDVFLKAKKVTKSQKEAIGEELKSVQRVFKLVPHYTKTNELRKQKIHSSQSIAAIGETRFVKEIAPKAGLEASEARLIFRKAEQTNAAAMLIMGELQDTMRAMDVASISTIISAKMLKKVGEDFPNLKSLFKLTDICACEHCRSVYSPAAYLVEILQFLDKRSVSDLTVNPHTTSNLAKDVLFERRPDLGEIDLGCANANTPVKYIDLVCELLEDAIAPDAGINYTGDLTDNSGGVNRVKIATALKTALQTAGLPVTDEAQVFETEDSSGLANTLPHYLRDKKVVCKIENTGGNNYTIFRLRQTLSSAEELAAAPEYVNAAAYTELSNKSYAFKLPFDLNHVEAKAYFNRFDISRAELMKDFQVAAVPANEAIAAEKLGLTDAERNLIVLPKPTLAEQQLIWNAPLSSTIVDVLDYMKRVDHFLDKTGLTFNELDLLLKLKFIDKNDNLFIKNKDLSCDTQEKEIANLDINALDRIHRFLRLQKKNAWKFETLDAIISQTKLGNGILNDACLIKAAELLHISEKTALKIDELIGFYGEIPNEILQEDSPKPLYYQVFLNKAKNGFIDEGLLPEKINNTQVINDDLKRSLAVCLQLKQQDFDKLLTLLPDGNLNFPNLSFLFAAARLAKKLKLKTSDFVIFTQLSSINISDSPKNTLDFIKVVEDFSKSPLKISEVKFMLTHQAENLADRVIKDDKIQAILEKLQKDYQANFTLNKSKFDKTLSATDQIETLQNELGKLVEIKEEDIKIIAKLFSGIWKFNWIDKSGVKKTSNNVAGVIEYLTSKLSNILNIASVSVIINLLDTAHSNSKNANISQNDSLKSIQDANIAINAATTPAELATANAQLVAAENLEAITSVALVNANKDLEKKKIELVKAFLDSIATFQLASGKQAILEQTIATSFKSDLEFVKVVLKYAQLKQLAPGSGLLSSILQSDNLIDNDPTHLVPIFSVISNSGAFVVQYNSIKLLHKLLPLISAFKLSNTDIEWYFKNNQVLNWFEFDSIPYAAAQVAIDFSKYLSFSKIVAYTKQFTPVANLLDAENPTSFFSLATMLLSTAVPLSDAFFSTFSILTGYEKEDLIAIDTHLFTAFDRNNYKNATTWERIIDCAECLRKLDSDISQIVQYCKPILLANDVNLLRIALKSRYDEDTWLETLKEIMDKIRPQKRNALVAYLLATNHEMKDENDLFDYFLVDVEMESCMPSSRIVLAHNTVQLFVQRCLMGLEPTAAANLNNDSNWNQWKWMRNYRVWEANRKVFLYPENWLESDLRDDKSFLFTEFENELQQNELTDFTAEQALIRYVEKLDTIAFLEVMATWYQTETKTMHVFARTKGGDPAIYYYRRFERERYWTPWEKVELDITGDHLLAFVRNNRLCLVWPIFSEEPDPNPKSKIPASTATPAGNDGVALDKPKKKLKIQLAISEFANKKWQPKKISNDAILAPKLYSNNDNDFKRDKYYVNYFAIPKINNFPISEVICVFTEQLDKDGNISQQKLNGIFNIAGCKGYPELFYPGPLFKNFKNEIFLPDFLPDFNDTLKVFQRYAEQNKISGDDLSVKNGINIFESIDFKELLKTTPGDFRISFPHQFTIIDAISLVSQLFFKLLNRSTDAHASTNMQTIARQTKIPMGTLLPYFEEDSSHAYVIIPGFYKKVNDRRTLETYTLNDSKKRTASDVFQLIKEIENFVNKLILKYKTTPVPTDIKVLIHEIITDPGFQKIVEELKFYEGFDAVYEFFIGKTNNEEIDDLLKMLIKPKGLVYGEQFKNMYHPLVCALRTSLYKKGIPELMKRETQLQKTAFDFKTYYNPNPQIVPQTFLKNPDGSQTLSYPVEDIDFNSDGSYSAYNWELFFHVPLLLATRLTKNQRFEEALTWFHYMFNPTGALSGNTPQKYWVTKPFYLNQEADYVAQRIDTLLYKIADPSTPEIKELTFAIEQWRNKPFKPDVVARFRPVTYQKALLMKYIDNLTEWGDYLFRQETMESVAQATQLYILADKLLGPKPRIIPPVVKPPYETYNQIERKLDAFGNALIDLENILPDFSVLPEGGEELPPSPVTLSMLYFCIPQNDKMLDYWSRIANRLYNIRHCKNIDGVDRNVALFAPPIDPAMLVRAAASGLDMSSILAGMNAPTPYYRFNVLSQKATELAQEVRGLGSSLLQALEKKDAEAMSLLRSELEIKVLNAVKDMKVLQIRESKEQIEILKRTKKVTEERFKFYKEVEKINNNERLSLDKLGESHDFQVAAQGVKLAASIISLLPDIDLGASGFGGSPLAAFKIGGLNLGQASNAASDILSFLGMLASNESARSSIRGGHERRFDDWKLQERLAQKELDSIEKQIAAADIRREIAENDLRNHELQIDNAKKTDEFMRTKFTNKELYDWMIGQISSVYFSAYQLSHDFAKKAERCYRFELGNDDTFISYGYWDSMKKGLQSADRLIHDIKRMETSYIDKNKREYELTKHVSLASLDTLALVRLRATGVCDFDIPEALYDMDHAGHYFRRTKSVSISLPCIAGPYTSVSAKLSLVNNKYRKNTNADNIATTGYIEDTGNDERFVYNIGAIQSIAASNAQNDSGVFELNFRDERYLPFEGTGAVSSWRLELPAEVRQFDYNSIADVIIHVKYTAREGGSGLKNLANTLLKDQLNLIKQQLSQEGLHIAINMKHDLPNEWHLLKANRTIDLKIDKSRLPYMAQTLDAAIEEVIFVAKIKGNPGSFSLTVDTVAMNLARKDEWQLCHGKNSNIDLDTPFNLSIAQVQIANLEELMIVVKYSF